MTDDGERCSVLCYRKLFLQAINLFIEENVRKVIVYFLPDP